MSSLIKGPLDGAAAVRGPAVAFADPPIFDPIAVDAHNASVREHRRCRVARCPLCEHASDKGPLAADLAPLPTTADVEHDGDRGPRPSRDPLAALEAAERRLLEAGGWTPGGLNELWIDPRDRSNECTMVALTIERRRLAAKGGA